VNTLVENPDMEFIGKLDELTHRIGETWEDYNDSQFRAFSEIPDSEKTFTGYYIKIEDGKFKQNIDDISIRGRIHEIHENIEDAISKISGGLEMDATLRTLLTASGKLHAGYPEMMLVALKDAYSNMLIFEREALDEHGELSEQYWTVHKFREELRDVLADLGWRLTGESLAGYRESHRIKEIAKKTGSELDIGVTKLTGIRSDLESELGVLESKITEIEEEQATSTEQATSKEQTPSKKEVLALLALALLTKKRKRTTITKQVNELDATIEDVTVYRNLGEQNPVRISHHPYSKSRKV
ncbi:MAG: hypothetical protein KAJ10_15240, partial [Thermodesulfovibrionia bacterium]|nr:hypothetical protein [Thermodesulfovibrionia bacterium]